MAYLLWQYLTYSAEKFPSQLAVICRGETLTYRELDEQSTQLATLLRAQGIGPGSRVGLYKPKSVKSVVTMLAVSKAGAMYVPLDPFAPTPRIAYILDNCQMTALATSGRQWKASSESLGRMASLRLVLLEDESCDNLPASGNISLVSWKDVRLAPGGEWKGSTGVESDPAYLLYTSGSTGQPKGVIISHRNAITFVDWAGDTFAITADDRLSNHAPLHFDLSVFDIYAALRAGACVVLVPDEVAPFPMQLAEWIETERISVWYSVPSALVRLLLHGGLGRFQYRCLRTILFAGEVFPVKYLRDLMGQLSQVEFFNLYGPTETNVCTFFKVPPLPESYADSISIGKACANTDVFVVDDQGNQVSPGEKGELLVRGPSVMLGYWGLPERTAQALVSSPIQAAYDEKVYRTGDYVRQAPDGNFIFLGRKDNMVKSRGYRIELGEIEHVLYQHEEVREAVVLAIPDEEVGARLKAVVAPHQNTPLSTAQLEGFCLSRLPRYMVPEAFFIKEELPKTSSGKADRVALRNELMSS